MSFLFLDKFPQTKLQQAIVHLKTFLKEGVMHNDWSQVFKNRKVGGSIAIPDQLVKSFKKKNITFTYNQFQAVSGIDTVVVFKDPRCLKWAIDKKKQGVFKKVYAGPFITNTPNEYGEIMKSSYIDGRIFFSKWHRDLFLDFEPSLQDLHIWFAGVDTDEWKTQVSEKRQFLIYYKTKEERILSAIRELLGQKNIDYKIIYYGQYSSTEYKNELEKSKAVIFLSRTETQGLAMFECWSCGVPSLHWNPGVWSYQGLKYDGASSCPYINPQCGLDFKNELEFEKVLEDFLMQYENFKPREYVAAGYTLEHSMERYLDIIQFDYKNER